MKRSKFIAELRKSASGRLPASSADRMVGEVDLWIERAISDAILGGATPEQAEEKVMRAYRDPDTLAATLAEEHYEGEARTGRIGQELGRPVTVAFGVFGVLHLLCLIAMNLHVFVPKGNAIPLVLEPTLVRSVLPKPLPFPDPTPLFLVWIGAMVLAPIFGGAIVGWHLRGRPALTTYQVLAGLILSNALVGLALYPRTEPILFAAIQTLWWVPVATATCWISDLIRRRHVARADRRTTATTASSLEIP